MTKLAGGRPNITEKGTSHSGYDDAPIFSHTILFSDARRKSYIHSFISCLLFHFNCHNFLPFTAMNNPGYGQLANPFANPPAPGPGRQQQGPPPSSYGQQPRYGETEALNDPYGSQNSSTTRLAGTPGTPSSYDQNGQFLPSYLNFCSHFISSWPRLQSTICFFS